MNVTMKREIRQAIRAGLRPLKVAEPLRLSEWADRHFYLSAESSYVEGGWKAYPYQVAILDAIGNDDIREVVWKKAARTGYTKILLAAMGYFAQHRRRNQAVWQPTDDDRDEFVKTELDPMLRDVAVMGDVFPEYLSRSKDNSLRQKLMLGSTIHLRGGKAAKNFRRLTVDVAILDELDGFDTDIEKEGSPDMLAAKRLEGATFPKLVMGSTPKLRGYSLIEAREGNAELRVSRVIPCPACGEEHALTWGGPKEKHGLKWDAGDPETVRHQCFACGHQYRQADYLAVWDRGRWRSRDGTWIDDRSGEFRNAAGDRVDPPKSIAFCGLWTAYSPQASWAGIVRDFLAATKKAKEGDKSALKTFTNTTLGETWEEEVDRTDSHEVARRAEPYRLRIVPMGGLVLVAGVDVQDNRFEIVTWAIGRGEESWVVDYAVIDANPADEREWERLDAYLLTEFPHAAGRHLRIEAAAVDTGGHFTHQAYNFCRHRARRRVYAIKGDKESAESSKPVKGSSSLKDVNWSGRIIRHGVRLWSVGTHTAKDLIYGRLQIDRPGPGYMHFSRELPPDFYAQLTAESRVIQRTASGYISRWINPPGRRNEVLDCTVYAIFAAHTLDLHNYTQRQWDRLEAVIQPQTRDLFEPSIEPAPRPDAHSEEKAPAPTPAPRHQAAPPAPPIAPAPAPRPAIAPPRPRSNFVQGWRR